MKKDIRLPVLTPDGRPWEDQPPWRHDFPIDVPEADFVARRDFTKYMVLTSFAFVVGQIWIGMVRAWKRNAPSPRAMRIARVADVPVGGAVQFNYPGPHDPCLLIRRDREAFVAYSSRCTHLACAVLPDVANDAIRCPCHVGVFDLATGRPLAGPPRRPLSRILLETRDGALYATGVEERTT